MRGVTKLNAIFTIPSEFQLTRLMRGVTVSVMKYTLLKVQFQLTRLMRGVTIEMNLYIGNRKFQLTRLMRGVTALTAVQEWTVSISTHTPHARRDG